MQVKAKSFFWGVGRELILLLQSNHGRGGEWWQGQKQVILWIVEKWLNQQAAPPGGMICRSNLLRVGEGGV